MSNIQPDSTSSMQRYLSPTVCFDANHPSIQQYAHEKIQGAKSNVKKSILLYYAVRDEFPYYPYELRLNAEAFRGSTVLAKKRGHCIGKASLLVTCCRAVNIPARIGFAKVINHIGVGRLQRIFRSEQLAPHGYVELYLNQTWIKVTPAFNKELCERIQVQALDFDGKNDALFQHYNQKGKRFMQYVEEYGIFDHIPIPYVVDILRQNYPHIFTDFDIHKQAAGVDIVAHYENHKA